MKPIPVVPANISAATKVPQHTPMEILMPVKISGIELGKITCLKICWSDAPREGEARIFDNWVPDAPVRAEITIIANATMNNKNIFPSSWIPKIVKTNGAHAKGGTGRYNSIMG